MMEKKQTTIMILDAVIVGIAVNVLGVPLHYLYDTTGMVAAGLIGPVNESTWEHFKLFFWPLIFVACVEYPLMRRRLPSYFLPKFVSMPTAFAAMSFFYYVPRALFGSSLLISIGSFTLGVVAAQFVFCRMARRPPVKGSEALGIFLIVLLGVLFIAFTFMPPHLLPWLDIKGEFFGINR